jgi:hypothetical protein
MLDKEEYQRLADFILSFPEMDDFIEEHPDIQRLDILLNEYAQFASQQYYYSDDLKISIQIAKEKFSEFIEQSHLGIHSINKTKCIDDASIICTFHNEAYGDKKPEYLFKKADVQHYRTITEKIAYQKVDFSPLVEKYISHYHPYVNMEIASAFINAKQYDIGLPFLQKVLSYVFSYPNIYWDNPTALYSCAEGIHMMQYLLGRAGMDALDYIIPDSKYRLLQLAYLYISRAIYMCDEDIASHGKWDGEHIPAGLINKLNFLSIRANLVYDYRTEFSVIFGIGINPDIQYIADKATASSIADRYGLSIIFEECFKDAMKMYRYGSLIPNDTGGYVDIEDATFGELIERGNIRSEDLANQLLKLYRESYFVLGESELAECIWFIKDKLCYSVSEALRFKEKRISEYKRWHEEWVQSLISRSSQAGNAFVNALSIKKSFASHIKQTLAQNNITCLYHFTDRANLESIIKNGGLYSWKYLEEHDISIPKQGGNLDSKANDQNFGLEDYVRLSFCDDHPMMWRLKCAGYNLVLLKIKVDVAWAKDTLFSDINATAHNHRHGDDIETFNSIDFNAVKQHYLNKSSAMFGPHQAEVMVKTCIPLEYILNIDNPIIR